ncbi:MAG TPA: glycosyltransferase [Methylomusa anaerophila]|uniref:Glycosyl transferases group 1 n=1 Tax=Methylomusa anaerophila TaxID=1930071 RepID=A0A348AKK1_9FIRM|nr:glycosyltransferase [Methylomusa anaerophila]BBB91599.1 glycosyl transferases group 1 [Methylomusa anaerophila]HML89463.1 glycosyltransferase [Methylomusa anaerophila]
MKIAIFESIITPGGHEVDFDRILVEELKVLGHEVVFYVPDNFTFNFDYGVPAQGLPGKAVSYTGVRGVHKILFSAKREINRQRWYRAVYERIAQGEADAVVVPTSTYRYLRALNINVLKKSPVPVIFILHGINPGEAPKFFAAVEKLQDFPNIKCAVISFGDTLYGRTFANVTCMNPPAYLPRDIGGKNMEPPAADIDRNMPLKLGFFGQYRREKKLDAFLDAFLSREYKRPVRLLVQGATMNPDDADDFQRIISKYGGHSHIEFLHKGLFGKEWQQAIAGVDILLMPYSAARYRYHWGGMLFTAIGYKKPVVVSDEINPEVTANYRIGMTYASGDPAALQHTIEQFINTYDDNAATYRQELDRAYRDFHPSLFASRIAMIAQLKGGNCL